MSGQPFLFRENGLMRQVIQAIPRGWLVMPGTGPRGAALVVSSRPSLVEQLTARRHRVQWLLISSARIPTIVPKLLPVRMVTRDHMFR